MSAATTRILIARREMVMIIERQIYDLFGYRYRVFISRPSLVFPRAHPAALVVCFHQQAYSRSVARTNALQRMKKPPNFLIAYGCWWSMHCLSYRYRLHILLPFFSSMTMETPTTAGVVCHLFFDSSNCLAFLAISSAESLEYFTLCPPWRR